MEIKANEKWGINSFDILGLNVSEFQTLCELKTRIKNVLETHKDEKKKNEYLSDDELKMIHAVLHVFTRDHAFKVTNTFEDALKALNKPVEKKPTIPVGEDQTFG